MTSIDSGTAVMLISLAIGFYSIGRKTECSFFVFCIFLTYCQIRNYLGKEGHLNFLILIFIFFSLITLTRFLLLKKYNKKLF